MDKRISTNVSNCDHDIWGVDVAHLIFVGSNWSIEIDTVKYECRNNHECCLVKARFAHN